MGLIKTIDMSKNRILAAILAASLALVAFPAEAQLVSGPHGSEDLKIGVAGFSYRNFSIDETLAMLQSMDVRYLSIKDWWLPLNSTKEQMDAFKKKCASYGGAFAYTQRYGIDMFIGVPDYDLIDYVISKVAETGIRVAIHTHGPDGAAFPSIYKIMELVKDPSLGVGCCLDMGHSVRSGEDIAKIVKKYHKWIYDIHIKDETAPSKAGNTWEMGRGVIDFRPIVKALRKVGYKGVVSVEFEKNGDNPHPGVAESIGYLRGILDGTK